MRRHLPLVLLVFGFIFLLLVFWPGAGRDWEEIDVLPGQSARDVSRMLKEKGVFRNEFPFRIWTKLRRAGNRIKAGRYHFSHGRSAFWVVDDLVFGRTVKVRVTIPEGFASWQIAERLATLKITSAQEFLDKVRDENLEGYLYPATYEFDYDLPPQMIINQMLKEFEGRWSKEMDNRAHEWGWSRHEAVTMASIIEREIRHREEMPLISSVYHNRLKRKMKLEADPTVQYALGYWKKRLTYRDYKRTQSPYNTYIHRGFPPGPVCNPGLEAMRAALWPANTQALYFVATEGGWHDFSRTFSEHTRKVNRRNRRTRGK